MGEGRGNRPTVLLRQIKSIENMRHKENNRRRPFMLWPLVLLLLFLALGGFYGGLTMLVDPTGKLLGVADVLPVLPVSNYVLPGLFLVVVMGLVPLLLSYALIAWPKWPWVASLFQWSQYHWAWTATLTLVAVLAIWLAVEGVLMGFFPITYITAALGGLLLLFALLPGRPYVLRLGMSSVIKEIES